MTEKKVILAEPRGFCAGVRRAIAIVEKALEVHGAPVYVRKEIVHNHYVVAVLKRQGAIFVDSEEDIPPGAVCVFSAHGVSPEVRGNAQARELTTIDATCPLVSKVHQEARRYARDGRTLLLVGHADHEEVEGTYGEAPDRTVIVESAESARELDLPRDTPVAVLTQTTLSQDETAGVIAELKDRFEDLQSPADGDICYASTNRQIAVKEIARRSDLVLIVGSRNSSNSVRMVEVARLEGTAAHLVPDVTELDTDWLTGVDAVGVSAGASAPEILIEQLLTRLEELGYGGLELATTAKEDVVFQLPSGLGQARPSA
ncbi:4-hydroxy-3-methylbut-2-enyl diphosphate reductase [Streptomyces albus]|uniref:4-hydroxy-3-methylbut-2-enyl diphosphate reductase n=1 Tax=Streptomyces physcomitrii TaxID=2724184 RepID=A0ABX1HCA5_9ACTN|nr:4-hydroxy-3-methylbut-2-enyl diphosphate reductase [Streptomyces sp. SCSIO ZS0520]AOU75767.1 4-hydroxy-3-methylbut-2-enyl diphosphate reductase [Streptomyces albus]NKI44869.1 4-hydroxy-3-methylbut-2-enyl diphosphate reductase [Streptomyces physcomitrii]UFZ14066.1 4-hydroxy-3-methylbut-2-enyl diphosphate reductase [Streptomyces sp.]